MKKSSIDKECVLLNLTVRMPGQSKKVDISEIANNNNYEMEEWVRASKSLFKSDVFSDIKSIVGKTKKWLSLRALPIPIKRGIYIIPNGLIESCQKYLDSVLQTFNSLADDFAFNDYPKQIDVARNKLGNLFVESDYFSPEDIRARFSFDWMFFELSPPSTEKMAKDLWNSEKAKIENLWQEAEKEITSALYVGFQELLDHLIDRLTPESDGKIKKFKANTVDNLKEFLELFEARNIVGADQLEALIKKAKDVLDGVDADKLRSNKDFAASVKDQMQEISNTLSEMVISLPTRSFSFS